MKRILVLLCLVLGYFAYANVHDMPGFLIYAVLSVAAAWLGWSLYGGVLIAVLLSALAFSDLYSPGIMRSVVLPLAGVAAGGLVLLKTMSLLLRASGDAKGAGDTTGPVDGNFNDFGGGDDGGDA